MKIAAGLVPTFELPHPNTPFQFEAVYTPADDTTKQCLERASWARAAVAGSVLNGSMKEVAQALDQYIPMLSGLMASIEKHQGMPACAGLAFSWSSGADQKPRKKYYKLFTLSFEMCMAMWTRAYCECNLAGAVLETGAQGEDPSKIALGHLKTAASMFAYIAGTLLPLKECLPYERPPEIIPDVARGLEHMCRTCCQLLAINQAIIRGLAPSIVAKLYVGAAQLCYQSYQSLQGAKGDWKDLNPSLKNFAAGGGGYFMGVAYRLLAKAEWEVSKYGEGVGFIRESKKQFDEAYAAGIMYFASSSLSGRVEADRTATIKVMEDYEKDNGLVYFGRVPAKIEAAEGKIVAAETQPYTPLSDAFAYQLK